MTRNSSGTPGWQYLCMCTCQGPQAEVKQRRRRAKGAVPLVLVALDEQQAQAGAAGQPEDHCADDDRRAQRNAGAQRRRKRWPRQPARSDTGISKAASCLWLRACAHTGAWVSGRHARPVLTNRQLLMPTPQCMPLTTPHHAPRRRMPAAYQAPRRPQSRRRLGRRRR